ncbi:MAG: hypothetical protein ACJ71H_12350 [Nitrososphaeraceae archaeon]
MKKSKERIQDFNKDIIDSYAKITNTSSKRRRSLHVDISLN